jgi:hypothetical protein
VAHEIQGVLVMSLIRKPSLIEWLILVWEGFFLEFV